MEVSAITRQTYTTEEYMAILADSEHKLEFIDGEIRMMAGGSRTHNRILKNAFRAMDDNPNGCEVFLSDTAVSLPKYNRYYFPDLTAVCDDEAEREAGGLEKLTNPCLIVEVLSESTGEIDRGEKFDAYRQLESFREYILIDSRKHSVQTYYRETNDLWHIRSYYKIDQELEVRTLGITVPLAQLYEGVKLTETENGHVVVSP